MWRIVPLIMFLAACSQNIDAVNSAEKAPAAKKPNILLIVADDMGYSDIGSYGSEIPTPNIDRLADEGAKFSNFLVGPTCSVTRSMIMSGLDNHRAGLGNMQETTADNQLGIPGYEGHLSTSVTSTAEMLKAAGYHTYMTGKWHLGTLPEHAPTARGFEQAFSLLYGGGSHFADAFGGDSHRDPLLYRDNGRLLNGKKELPKDFYATDFYTDRMIKQIDSNIGDGKPFFGWLAYTAPHWPLQVPEAYLDKYKGKYDVGYDKIREQRFAKQKELGLIPASLKLPPRPKKMKAWDDLSVEKQAVHARNMELYAAMMDYMDMSIGRVLAYLEKKGELDNTIVMFISDNGADKWSHDKSPKVIGKWAKSFDNSPENAGRMNSFIMYGPEWAHVGSVPFRSWKGDTYEGALRSPLVVRGPGVKSDGKIRTGLTHVTDLYATYGDIAGGDYSQSAGKSLVPMLKGADQVRTDDTDVVGVSIWASRAVIGPRYKLLSPKPKYWKKSGGQEWYLYDLVNDPSERVNLIDKKPEIAAFMKEQWLKYMKDNNVILPKGFVIRPPVVPTK